MMLKQSSELHPSPCFSVWLRNLGCLVLALLLAAAWGVPHLGQVASILLCFALLSSFVQMRLVASLDASHAIAWMQRLAQGDFTSTRAGRSPGPNDRLGQALGGLALALHTRSAQLQAGGTELIRASKQLQNLILRCGNGAVSELTPTPGFPHKAAQQLSRGVTEITRATVQLAGAARESFACNELLARGADEMVDNADQLVRVEQQMHATLGVVVDNIMQAKESIVELAESAIETSSRVFDIDESITLVDRNAQESVAISQKVLQDARVGKLAVESTLQGMVEIDQHSARAARVIGGLSKKAADIGFILNVIKEVAEQTALLSLNAAIISAQAGIHGRGFAVVASEIKTLSTRTRQSVDEIAKVIDAVQNDTQLAVAAISTAALSIKAGEALALRSNDALEKIVAGVGDAAEQVAGIAEVAKAQAASSQVIREGTEQMSRTICEISGVICFLGDENEQILGTTERIAGLVARLRDAAREQGLTSGRVAGGTDQLLLHLAALEADCGAEQLKADQFGAALQQPSGAQQGRQAGTGTWEQDFIALSRAGKVLDLQLAHFLSQADPAA